MVQTGKRRGKPRSRILYWFRTPPGVRVGRSALDEDAIRMIEEHHPEVNFDWDRMLKAEPESRVPQRAAREERASRGERAPREVPRVPEVPEVRVQVPEVPEVPVPEGLGSDVEELRELREEELAQPEPMELAEPEPLEPWEPEPEPLEPEEPWEPQEPSEPPEPAAKRRLGAEGVGRLRARYSETMARISERIPDPARQDELKTQAERLNPDTWVTDAEVTAGLEQYEATFEALRAVIGGGGSRRRRRRRRPRDGAAGPAGTGDVNP